MSTEQIVRGRRGLACTALLAGAMVVAGSSPADAHLGGGHILRGGTRWSAVTEGPVDPATGLPQLRLRVRNDPRYGSLIDHAVRVWAEVPGGPVVIILVGKDAEADVTFKEIDNCEKAPARYLPVDGRGPRPDPIVLNACELTGSNESRNKAAVAHELGHALGLGHFNPGRGQLMDKVWQGQVTSPQGLDVEHYLLLWAKRR